MNNKPRTIFIGDIHGCYEEFLLLIQKLKIQEIDRVFLTGDMISKGPNDIKIMSFLLKNREQYKAILGNAEFGIIQYLKGNFPEDSIWYNCTGEKVRELKKENPDFITYILSLPEYIEEEDFILVHAGIKNSNINNTDIGFLTGFDRKSFNIKWYETYNDKKKVIYGHNSISGLNVFGNTIGIDSGCVSGGYLTAYILETDEIIQQKAESIYYIEVYEPKFY